MAQNITMPSGRTFFPIEEEDRTCEDHGDYHSVHYELRPSTAPDPLKKHWTNCPDCDAFWTREAEKVEREMKDGDTIKEQVRAERHANAKIPARFAYNTIFDWLTPIDKQRAILSRIKDYCHSIDTVKNNGRSLIFTGQAGTGKTHLAVGIIVHAMEHGCTAAYTTVMDMLSSIKDTYNKNSSSTEAKVVHHFSSVDYLVIDEVGKQLPSEYDAAQLFRILDNRYRDMHPTILVSNMEAKELKAFLGEPLVDRLREGGGKVFVFDWASHRSKKS